MRNHKIGLVLALLLGLSDIAILGALGGDDGSEKPPLAIVLFSVIVGLATIALVVMAWRQPTRRSVLAIIVLRAISGLGDIAAFGESAAVVTVSIVFLVLSIVAIYLLWGWMRELSSVPGSAASQGGTTE
ncbi:hypothetical protein BH10ACT1_BH10ACT1_18840 [soil metagenome]